MDPLQAILSFTVASALLTVTPGIDTALVLRTATVKGQREALAVALGTVLGCLVWCALVSWGLGAILLVSELFYNLLRSVGACYLLALGVQMILKSKSHDFDVAAITLNDSCKSKLQSWFYQGLFNNLLNPKVGVFYVTFLPQFIPQDAHISTFGLVLGSIHAIEGLVWFSLLTLITRPLSAWLKQPEIIKTLDCLTGSVLIFFGIKLVLEPHHAN